MYISIGFSSWTISYNTITIPFRNRWVPYYTHEHVSKHVCYGYPRHRLLWRLAMPTLLFVSLWLPDDISMTRKSCMTARLLTRGRTTEGLQPYDNECLMHESMASIVFPQNCQLRTARLNLRIAMRLESAHLLTCDSVADWRLSSLPRHAQHWNFRRWFWQRL